MFEVTDNKQGAARFGIVYRTVKKGLTQAAQQLPLRRACVLRLVNQHMADRTIQLPCDPVGSVAARQHAVGQGNQIVIIQHAQTGLQGGIGLVKGMPIGVERGRQIAAAQIDPRRNKAGERILRALQHCQNVREVGTDILV